MNRTNKVKFLNKVLSGFEVIIGLLLLIVILVKLIDLAFALCSIDITLLAPDFEDILTIVFNLIIGTEFVKMLYKHSTEALLEVLLFATARTMVLPSSDTTQIIVGTITLCSLFAIKKFLLVKKEDNEADDNKKSIWTR